MYYQFYKIGNKKLFLGVNTYNMEHYFYISLSTWKITFETMFSSSHFHKIFIYVKRELNNVAFNDFEFRTSAVNNLHLSMIYQQVNLVLI